MGIVIDGNDRSTAPAPVTMSNDVVFNPAEGGGRESVAFGRLSQVSDVHVTRFFGQTMHGRPGAVRVPWTVRVAQAGQPRQQKAKTANRRQVGCWQEM